MGEHSQTRALNERISFRQVSCTLRLDLSTNRFRSPLDLTPNGFKLIICTHALTNSQAAYSECMKEIARFDFGSVI
jgi:hypothetical protein